MEKETQIKMVKNHLIKFGSITPLEALRTYGCYRLSDVIFKLRNRGMEIETFMPIRVKKNEPIYATYYYPRPVLEVEADKDLVSHQSFIA